MKAVNLLPEDQRPRGASGARSGSGYWAVAILAVLVLAVGLYVHTTNQITDREQQLAIAEAETAEAESRMAGLATFGNFTQVKQTRLASVAQLAEGRFDWERFVRELAHVLPADAWLFEVEATATGEDEDGASPGAAGASAAGTPSARLSGCSPSQHQVATAMVRLRQLYRAVDVSLVDSLDELAEGGSSDSCGGLYEFTLIVNFAATPPVQGTERVPAALGGGQ